MELQELKIVLDWAKENRDEAEKLFTTDPAKYRPRFIKWKEIYERIQGRFDHECMKYYDKHINA